MAVRVKTLPPLLTVVAALALAACSTSADTTASPGPVPTSAVTAVAPSASMSAPATSTAAPALPGTSAIPAAPTSAQPSGGGRAGTPEVLATGLQVPWGLAFLPDGSALLSERDTAKLLRVAPGGEVSDVGTVEGVAPAGEGGLLGLAVAPDYERSPAVFAYYTGESDNRVVRLPLAGEGAELRLAGPGVPIVTGIKKASIHNGGRIAFGPDGLLYAGTGDAGLGGASQDRGSLNGKILRVTAAGEPAPGNPFPGSPVYSLGHRNVQGLAFDDTGRLFATEFGQNTTDEVNVIAPGVNYGWPEVEGLGGRDAVARGFRDPVTTWDTSEASPSGAAFAGGAVWVAALRGARLWRVPVTADGAGEPEALFTGEFGRLRTVVRAPDGALWLTTSNRDGRGNPGAADDRLLRVPLT